MSGYGFPLRTLCRCGMESGVGRARALSRFSAQPCPFHTVVIWRGVATRVRGTVHVECFACFCLCPPSLARMTTGFVERQDQHYVTFGTVLLTAARNVWGLSRCGVDRLPAEETRQLSRMISTLSLVGVSFVTGRGPVRTRLRFSVHA